MRIGLFGGSFDPIHAGHIAPVKEAVTALGLDRVYYLPTARPPHKPTRRFAPAFARFAMVELALLAEQRLFAAPFEMSLDRPAFTIDSVEHFRASLPGAEIYVLLGDDALAEIDQWHRWRDILRQAHLGVLVRSAAGSDAAREVEPPPALSEWGEGDRIRFVRNRRVEVSSTHLRGLLARREALPEGALPDLVVQYIEKYDLYR